ncbi:MAG TPA: ATP-binding protein [Gammaproteobacteria bacterium]|nr:ATP-binding protein [Gammaproteobacteria bacterium]
MTDINLADVTIHIDRETDTGIRDKIDTALRNLNGVISVHMPNEKPHLLMVEYNPDATTSQNMLHTVRELAGHAEMISL